MSEESQGTPHGHVKREIAYVLIAALIAVIVVGYLYYSSQRKVVGLMQLSALQTQRLDEFGQLADRVRGFNAKFGARFGKVQTIEDMTALQNDLNQIKQQPNLPTAVDSLIGDFEETAAKIDYLGDKIDRIEKSLGSPHIVKANDSHASIVMDYLTREAGLSKDEAKKVMKRTALDWELEPGNYVYNLYYDGIFLTTVTQGTAKQSPLLLQQRVRQSVQKRLEELEAKMADTTQVKR